MFFVASTLVDFTQCLVVLTSLLKIHPTQLHHDAPQFRQWKGDARWHLLRPIRFSLPVSSSSPSILGDPGADSGDEGKSKRAGKCGAKKSKERREEPLGTMSYETSSKRSPPFCLLIGARKPVFSGTKDGSPR